VILTAAAGILIWSTSHSEADPGPYSDTDINVTEPADSDSDTDIDDILENITYDSGEDGGNIDGADWRTWRSYIGDYVISEDLTVCLSLFDNLKGYAVYDSSSGDRIGSLSTKKLSGNEDISCKDIDGDGINELGIKTGDDYEWFRYTNDADDGCFEEVED